MLRGILYHVALIFYFIGFCSAFTCLHDDILEKRSAVHPRSIKPYLEITKMRNRDPALFENLSVFYYFDNIDRKMSFNGFYNVKIAFESISEFLGKNFQVRKRTRPFRLDPETCGAKWDYGKNRGKCSKHVGKLPLCALSDDIFIQIPETFLAKLEVYDHEDPKPKYVINAGNGLLNYNFILFVTSYPGAICSNQNDLVAYGMHCRVDPLTNEPLAGILNICPGFFENRIYPQIHYYNVFLHEVFHILGFSKHHFEKFLPCEKGIYCEIPTSSVLEDSNGVFRMMYPLVIKNMQIHFNCSNKDFGGPMHLLGNKTYSSHWDPVLMYSSIMTPAFSERDSVVIDNITLAAFASTGWYRVAFGESVDFSFGKGQGCDFGQSKSCDGPFFCSLESGKNAGCDLKHVGMGRCEKISNSFSCGVFKPIAEESCNNRHESEIGLPLQAMNLKQKCFHQENSNQELQPICAEIRCNSTEKYHVRINTTWYPCEDERRLPLPNGTLICAPGHLFCADAKIFPVYYDKCPKDYVYFISVRVYFKVPSFEELRKSFAFKSFKMVLLNHIANEMGISTNLLLNSSMNVFKKVYLDFSICPPLDANNAKLYQVLKNLQSFLDQGDILDILKSRYSENIIIASGAKNIHPSDLLKFTDHEGFHALLIFVVIAAILFIVVAITSLLRFLMNQRDRPKQSTPNDEEFELNQTGRTSEDS